MSVCFDSSGARSNSAGSVPESEALQPTSINSESIAFVEEGQDVSSSSSQSMAKLVLTAPNATSVLQKVPTTSVMVVNASGPLAILKTLCSNSCGTSAPQFTLVNSTPLSVNNVSGKPIAVVGASPIKVIRTVSNFNSHTQTKENSVDVSMNNVCTVSSINGVDKTPTHNVFVKNTVLSSDLISGLNEVVSPIQKLVPGNSFIHNNVMPSLTANTATNIVNGQKQPSGMLSNNKLKIINNIVIPSPTSGASLTVANNIANTSNAVLAKSVPAKHFLPQKILSDTLNGASKLANKKAQIPSNFPKTSNTKNMIGGKVQKLYYPGNKSHIRTMPPSNNPVTKIGLKTLSPQLKSMSNQQSHKSGAAKRTVSSQRSLKLVNKPNYIGKHAIQGQKIKNVGKQKNVKPPAPSVKNVFPHRTPQNTGIMYHQVLTANIIQSLSENGNSGRTYDYTSSYNGSRVTNEPTKSTSYPDPYVTPSKPQSNLDTLSFVCQAVLLDHNYNAAPPTDTINRNTPTTTIPTQLNGSSVGLYYSPTTNTRNRLSLGAPTNTPSTFTSASTNSLVLSNTSSSLLHDDDAASDISCGSEHKMETEGEETDTAPEAEAVNNESYNDHYGDYVTRCLCGFLHDDGYMIECDKCKVWQHVRCVIKNNKKVPDDYLCEMCDSSKPVDRAKARTLQQQWMRENQERDAKLRKEVRMQELKLKETLSDSDSSDGEQMKANVINKNRMPAGRRKGEPGPKLGFRQRRDSSKTEMVKRPLKRKERKMTKKRTKVTLLKNQSDEDNQDTWTNSTISQIPHLRQWIENYEEAVTNHYSPELRARILSIRINGVHSELSSQVNNSVHMCRVHTQPLTGLKYLVSTANMESNTPVVELRGKYMLSTQHRGVGAGHGNTLSTRQHSQRPGPFLFFYRLHRDNTEVCVDTRTYGNDARFVRRSCTPNAELQHCIEKGVLHLYIVTLANIERNIEITIKHESHDLAAVGTTNIACACGDVTSCIVNKISVKRNGENVEKGNSVLRRRRGRRTVSSTSEQEQIIPTQKIKEEPVVTLPVEVKVEPEITLITEIKVEEPKIEFDTKFIKEETLSPVPVPVPDMPMKTEEDKPINLLSPNSLLSSNNVKKLTYKSDGEDQVDSPVKEQNNMIDKKKLSREERKIEAYMKAFERLERQELKKKDHQAKQAHRRESEPGPHSKDEEKFEQSKTKRRRRKGRARTVSINSQTRRNRVNSADSSYATSGEECLLSPNSNTNRPIRAQIKENERSFNKDSDLLLTLANCDGTTRLHSPIRDIDCNSNSANSSPETPMSSACLLVAAAVEPLEPSFKFPKTKKGMMNEWLNKSPECVQSASSISPSSLTPHFTPTTESNFYETTSTTNFFAAKNLANITSQVASFCEVPTQTHGSAKKRWLRQAISEDRSESPNISTPDSPPLSDTVAPPKKRKLPRESLESDTSIPTSFPATNTSLSTTPPNDDRAPYTEQEDRVEIVTAGADGDSPIQVLIDDAALKERVAEMQQEIGACFRLPEPRETTSKEIRSSLDPRLTRSMFNNSEHLVATVEKNLSILGFEDEKQDNFPPTKRKLSISEYRQRKQLTTTEKSDELSNEDSSMSRSPSQKLRRRSNSASSTASFISTDEEEIRSSEPPPKVLSAFNSEPTELEKQRESVSLRLKKAFGLVIDEEAHKTGSKLENLLSSELNTIRENLPVKSTDSISVLDCSFNDREEEDEEEEEVKTDTSKVEDNNETVADDCESKSGDVLLSGDATNEVIPEMFYTPDEDDGEKLESLLKKVHSDEEHMECINYVPPFNNPVYPNSSFTSFGSVIDDDAPYEGRNPSPPPELSSVSSFSSP